MTVEQKRKVLVRMAQLESDIDLLREARIKAVANGYASASISSAGGSKSWTRMTPDQITSVIDELLKELEQLRALLTTGLSSPLKTQVTIYW